MDSQHFAPSVLLDLKDLAHSLREVSKDVIQTESQNIVSRWYHSEKSVDLFVWQDEKGNVIKQQVSVHGAVTEWNIIDGVKTGIVWRDDSRSQEHELEGSEVIRFDDEIQETARTQAVKLLEHLSVLEYDEKQRMIKNFKTGSNVSTMDPEAFLKTYGPASKPSKTPSKPWYWGQWLKRLLLRLFGRY